MKQNIRVQTIKELNQAKGLHFFENLKKRGHTHSEMGYMSKNGQFAWFWTCNSATKEYVIQVFSFARGCVMGSTNRARTDANLMAKAFCEAYDRDQTFVTPRPVVVPASIPKENYDA